MRKSIIIAALIGSVATSYGLSVDIGSAITVHDNVFAGGTGDLLFTQAGQITAGVKYVDAVKVQSVKSAGTAALLDLQVSFGNQFSGSAVSKPLTITTESDVTLTGPVSFTANIGGKNAAGGSSYFLAYLDSALVFDSRTVNDSFAYGAGDYSGNHYVIPGAFGSAGTHNLQLLAVLDVPAATAADLWSKGNFNASLNFSPATVPEAGATVTLLAFAFGSLVAIRRRK